jgi:hypothetical protein
MKLTEQQIQQLQNKYIGKIIRIPYINTTGFGIIKKDDYIQGICSFIGYNKFIPNWNLQVNINRTPVSDVDYLKIIIV